MLFNRTITGDRYDGILEKLKSFEWFPKFTNIYYLKGDKKWEEIDFTKVRKFTIKEAYSTMPKEMIDYIKSLPEYDKEIYKIITEGVDK